MSQKQFEPKPPSADPQPAVFVRMPGVVLTTGLGRSTIYRLIAEDKFPSPVQLSTRAVAWRRVDLEHWSAGRPTVSHRLSSPRPALFNAPEQVPTMPRQSKR